MNKLWLQLSVGFCVGLLPAAAQAQQAQGSADESSSNDIVVTANKREENLSKVGLTITAIGAQALQTRRVSSLEDVAAIAPGLIYTPSTNNTPIFTLRGIGFNESSLGVYPAVSVYVDQTPLPFPVLAMHSAYDLERIEVLKGPQGTLFGQNSTGGAINYIAAKPSKVFEAGGDMSFGRFNAVEGNAYISGPISEHVRGRLAVTGKNADGWQYSYTQPNEKNGKESYLAGRLTLDADVGDTVKLSFSANGWKDTSDPQAQQLIATHEQIGAGFSKVLTAAPLVDDLRNAYSPPPAGCASAQICYPFSPFNSRAADWGVSLLDPSTSPAAANPDPFAAPNGVTGSSDPALATNTSFRPRGDRDFWQVGLRGDVEIGTLTLTSLTSYAKFRQKMTIDGDGMSLAAFDIQQGNGSIETFNQELRLANDSSSRIRWVLGANYEKSTTSEDQVLRYWANSNYNLANEWINHSGVILDQRITNFAGFASTEFEVTDKLTLKASGRYTHSKIDATNAAYTSTNGNVDKLFNFLGGPNLGGNVFVPIGPSGSYTLNGNPANIAPLPADVTITSPVTNGGFLNLGIPGVPLQATLKQSNVSWRFGFDYKATDTLLIYANVSRGYKAGSFPALAAASYISGLPVTQEKVTAYEAGLKLQAMDGKIQFNTAAFYMDYRDKQVKGKLFDFVFGTLDTLVNVPKSRIYGMEADLTVRPTRGLTISGAVTYLKSKVLKFTGYDIFGGVDNNIDSRPGNFDPSGGTPNTENLAGVRLPYTPEWAGSVNVDYRHELSNGGTPFAGFTVSARSNQTAAIGGEDTTLPTGGNVRYRIAPGVGKYPYMIDGFATVDARLGYEGPDGAWKVMLWGKNLFNKYYWTAVIPSSDSSSRLAGKPVTYGITMGFKIR
jgi:outer membrane receptor protein involved in Fe transport